MTLSAGTEARPRRSPTFEHGFTLILIYISLIFADIHQDVSFEGEIYAQIMSGWVSKYLSCSGFTVIIAHVTREEKRRECNKISPILTTHLIMGYQAPELIDLIFYQLL